MVPLVCVLRICSEIRRSYSGAQEELRFIDLYGHCNDMEENVACINRSAKETGFHVCFSDVIEDAR